MPAVQPPLVPGFEGCGVVVNGTGALAPGPKVTYVKFVPPTSEGAYAEFTAVDAQYVFALPEGVDMKELCAVTFQGLTAHYLVELAALPAGSC